MPDTPNKRPLNMRLDAQLMEVFEAEAKQLGRTNSEHGRTIIADHLEGRSIERVRLEMAELTEEVAKLKEQLGGHTAAVHFVARLFLAQHELSAEQWSQVDEQFKGVRAVGP